MTWEKGGNVALREEVPKVCLELQVSQVTQAPPATGGLAGMASEGPQEWQEFLVYPAPQDLPALLVSASRPPAPCRPVSEHSAKAPTSDGPSTARSLHEPCVHRSLEQSRHPRWGNR